MPTVYCKRNARAVHSCSYYRLHLDLYFNLCLLTVKGPAMTQCSALKWCISSFPLKSHWNVDSCMLLSSRWGQISSCWKIGWIIELYYSRQTELASHTENDLWLNCIKTLCFMKQENAFAHFTSLINIYSFAKYCTFIKSRLTNAFIVYISLACVRPGNRLSVFQRIFQSVICHFWWKNYSMLFLYAQI